MRRSTAGLYVAGVIALEALACAVIAGSEDVPTPVSVDSGPKIDARTTADASSDASRETAHDTGADVTVDADGASVDGGITTPLSCQMSPDAGDGGGDGLTNCGALHESCCTSSDVFSEGQAYARTYTYSSLGPIDAADYATLGGLRLDKYEVTVGRFRQFVTYWNRHGYTPPPDSGKHEGHGLSNSAYPDASSSAYETGWLNSDNLNFDPTTSNLDCRGPDDAHYATWTLTPGVNETRPINCVNWYEAYAFCIWDGGFLPSEAEWEYVAAHGTKYLEFPWGQTPPGTSNQYAIYNCDYPDSSAVCSSAANIAPVGTAAEGASLIGPLDLAGNVAEWVLDAYAPKYANPCDECTYEPTSCNDGGCNRVFRGSDFSATLVSSLYPTYREFAAPTARSGAVGFRCARQ